MYASLRASQCYRFAIAFHMGNGLGSFSGSADAVSGLLVDCVLLECSGGVRSGSWRSGRSLN